MNYKEQYKHPKWQEKRLKIFNRDKWTCKKCGDKETTLHVHHKEYHKGAKVWEYNNKDLITLCSDCHSTVELYKRDYCDENKNIDISKIRIYKSNTWRDGNKIIFASYNGIFSMEVYDKNNKFLVGFNLKTEISHLIRLLNYSKKYKKS